jgi:hypothetical protein
VKALEQQLTQHMCISTTLTTQLAMQLQQAMLTRQQTTTPSMVNVNIPPAYGNLNQPFNNYMGYPNSLQQNFPFQPAHVGYPAHSQQQNSPYQTGPLAFNQQQNFPYARQESKKEDSTNSTIKNSGLDKQYQGGKNYDLRDAIKRIEGIKLIQQEQQKKYFLTIPSLLKVPPNLYSLQMETEVSRI